MSFMSSATGYHDVAEILLILKGSYLVIDGALTRQLKYNLMKLSVSVDMSGDQTFLMKPRFSCCNPLTLLYNNTVWFSEEMSSVASWSAVSLIIIFMRADVDAAFRGID